ncbi:DUF6965 family protein [Chryseobacterium indologenes]|uniref:DUF6965 family protein n=1 Tax=Chryseobacterium indologenes TaxID=253 RepID=UPI00374DE470
MVALENFFSGIELQNISVKPNSCSIISDIPKFIKNHLSVVKANNGNHTYSPYLSRLQELKNKIGS